MATPSEPTPSASTSSAEANEPFRSVQPVCSAGHVNALAQIRAYIKTKTCYDILPESFRTITLDTRLSIRQALNAMHMNGVVSAPLYNATTSSFAGMLTLTDAIHVIQYYYHTQYSYDDAQIDVDYVQLSRLRDIEEQIDAPPPPTVSIHPDQTLYDACAALVRTHARRLPVIDQDDESGKDLILSVLTQYRVLKFIAINCHYNALRLTETIGDLGIGTYIYSYGRGAPRHYLPKPRNRPRSRSVLRSPTSNSSSGEGDPDATSDEESMAWAAPITVATLETTIFDIVHHFSEGGISAVPIVDDMGRVINLYETVDIIDLIRDGSYRQLDLTVREAIAQRPKDFSGVVTCTPEDTLASILDYIRTKRVHRMVIVEGEGPSASSATGGSNESASPAVPSLSNDTPSGSPMPQTPPRQITPRVPGRLIGLLCLSDVLRYLVGTNRSDFRGYEIEGLGFRPPQTIVEGKVPSTTPPPPGVA